MTMQAYKIDGKASGAEKLRLVRTENIFDAGLEPDEVLINIMCCSLYTDGIEISFPSGTIPGAGVVGLVQRYGSRVKEINPELAGAECRVGVSYGAFSCGDCYLCKSGHVNRCPNYRLLGEDGGGRYGGGLAEYAIVDAAFCFVLPKGMKDTVFPAVLTVGALAHRVLEVIAKFLPGVSAHGYYGPQGLAVYNGKGGQEKRLRKYSQDDRCQRLTLLPDDSKEPQRRLGVFGAYGNFPVAIAYLAKTFGRTCAIFTDQLAEPEAVALDKLEKTIPGVWVGSHDEYKVDYPTPAFGVSDVSLLDGSVVVVSGDVTAAPVSPNTGRKLSPSMRRSPESPLTFLRSVVGGSIPNTPVKEQASGFVQDPASAMIELAIERTVPGGAIVIVAITTDWRPVLSPATWQRVFSTSKQLLMVGPRMPRESVVGALQMSSHLSAHMNTKVYEYNEVKTAWEDGARDRYNGTAVVRVSKDAI
eukprot:Clim_evm13s154 gene=Clim_evmTU13s154